MALTLSGCIVEVLDESVFLLYVECAHHVHTCAHECDYALSVDWFAKTREILEAHEHMSMIDCNGHDQCMHDNL